VPFIGTQPSGQLYRDMEILPTYQDFAKTHANPDTDGNSTIPPSRYHSFTGYYEIDAYTLTQSILDNLT